jgi:hypothetical protein
MVRDENWSWTDIGRAMTLAGITYASGTPWTGALLNVKMAQARTHLRARDAKRPEDARRPAPPGPGRSRAGSQMPIEAPRIDGAMAPEPTFALAALAPTQFSPPAASDDSGGSTRPSSARKRVDVDEVIRRLQGGGARPDNED